MAPWAQRKLLGSASPTGGFAVGNTLPQAGVAASSAAGAYFQGLFFSSVWDGGGREVASYVSTTA
jgi:hypothetical protein